jgi:integrase/recombinase XerD
VPPVRIVDVNASRATEQLRDLDSVAHLWRKLGHSPGGIAVYSDYVKRLLREARGRDYRELCADRVVHLALAYARRRQLDPRRTRRMWLASFRAFAWGLQRLGKMVGSVDLNKKPRVDPDPVVEAYIQYGKQVGWSDQTLHSHLRYLYYLRRFLIRRGSPWPVPELRDIDCFLQLAAKRWVRTTVATAAGTFRSWLRFLFVTGRSAHDLASSVALPPRIAYPRPARALPWATVRQLRHGIDTSTPIGRRDDAQYLLFCAYGLSSAELTNLTLEDIDWHAGILHVRRVKNGATVDLPLLPAVAKAIAVYLRRARPQSSSRHVFIRHTIPFSPLSHATVGQRVVCWAERAHVKAPFLGAHLFRHSVATHHLERGTPLKVIGDILGHSDCRSTGVYVRTAMAKLRRLALPVPV